MRKTTMKPYILFAAVVACSLQANAVQPGEGVVLDSVTGNYTITYCGLGPVGAKNTCALRQVVFVPATKIKPHLKSFLELDRQWNIRYSYAITNGSKSAQPLISYTLDPITNIVSTIPLSKKWGVRTEKEMEAEVEAGRKALREPNDWEGDVFPSDKGGLRVVWNYRNTENTKTGVKPGMSQSGFSFSSKDIPGIVEARLAGNADFGPSFVDEGPDGEIAEQLHQLQINDFISRYAAAPAIAVPSPFDLPELLKRIQSHTQNWIGMKLVDPGLSSQLDRLFQAAIDAATRNNPQGIHTALKDIQHLLKREHPDLDSEDDHDEGKGNNRLLIDKLAARVLDFDLQYVLKHAGENR